MINFKDILPIVLDEFNLKPLYFKNNIDAIAHDISNSTKKYPVVLFETNTSGEKLYEEFYTHSEDVRLNVFESLGIISVKDRILLNNQNDLILSLKKLFNKENLLKEDIVTWLNNYIPEFCHIETGNKLDNQM